jgi:ATP-binding cassette subfamily F protein 3
MIITHDRDFMNSVTTHTMAIHRKKMKKLQGDTYKMTAQIASDEIVYEQTRQQEDRKRREAEEFINRFRAQASRASLVQSRMKALERMGKKQELDKIAELGFKFNYKMFEAKFPMRAENLGFGYKPEEPLFKGLSFDVAKDDRICVIGKNGKGKSTLLKLLAGELEPTAGTIKRHPECGLGFFGQTNIERLDAENTIEQEYFKLRPDLKRTEIRGVCGAMMFPGDAALKKISVLSGGEKSRVSLGKILLNQANLLLLDEPTNHLDIESCDSMITALDTFPGAVIIVTHSEMFLHHLANRLIVFDGGNAALFEGSYQDFLDRVGWSEEEKEKKKGKKAAEQAVKRSEGAEEERRRKKISEQIAAAEKAIDEKEALLEAANAKLAEAYKDPDPERIRELQIESHGHSAGLEEGYRELERLIAALDGKD